MECEDLLRMLPITKILELCVRVSQTQELETVTVFRADQDMVMSVVQTPATLSANGTLA
jgi:hypothetical protein